MSKMKLLPTDLLGEGGERMGENAGVGRWERGLPYLVRFYEQCMPTLYDACLSVTDQTVCIVVALSQEVHVHPSIPSGGDPALLPRR